MYEYGLYPHADADDGGSLCPMCISCWLMEGYFDHGNGD